MKQLLVLGAGQSSPYLVRRLLDRAPGMGWRVVVADRDRDAACRLVGGADEAGEALGLDASDDGALHTLVEAAAIVLNLLPPSLQAAVARACLDSQRPMVSVSYRDRDLRALDAEAVRRGVLLLAELGLDPGLDHLSAIALVEQARSAGAAIEAFRSYGGGLPAPESTHNPWRYAVTWNPRNVVMAGRHGALYRHRGYIRVVPWSRIFTTTWPVVIPGLGTFDAYPNRDSLRYQELFDLPEAHSFVRATLRYPGWCETWSLLVELGLPNEEWLLAEIGARTWAELTERLLPAGAPGRTVRERAAWTLKRAPSGGAIDRLDWLGLFADRPLPAGAQTPAEALAHLLRERLTLAPGDRDLVVLRHELEVRPQEGRRELWTSTLIERGDLGGFTAMARTVGLPAAVAAELVLAGEIEATGSLIPTDPRIYGPLVPALGRHGLHFAKDRRPLPL